MNIYKHILLAFAAIIGSGLASAQNAGNSLSHLGTTINQDENKEITIALNNTVSFTAFQCDITIPETVQFVTNNDKVITGSSRMLETHKIIEKILDNNTVRILVYSTDNTDFNNESDGLFSFTVAAKEPTQDSVAYTVISNIVFSHVENNDAETYCVEYAFDDLTFGTFVSSIDAASIEQLEIYASGKNIIILSPKNTTLQFTNVAGQTMPLEVSAGKNIFPVEVPGVYLVNDTKLIIQ